MTGGSGIPPPEFGVVVVGGTGSPGVSIWPVVTGFGVGQTTPFASVPGVHSLDPVVGLLPPARATATSSGMTRIESRIASQRRLRCSSSSGKGAAGRDV